MSEANHDHLMKQIALGEFDPPYLEESRSMTAQDFAKKHGVDVKGTGVYMYRVDLGPHEYFWNVETGNFDGFGRMSPGVC